MSVLFTPLTIREIEFRNRVFVSPMCQYSAPDGRPTDWHMVHLGSRAVGGAGLVFTEASAVSHEGRISPDDAGIWNEAQGDAWRAITRFLREHGSVAGIQLAHAGRKASTQAPWLGDRALTPAERGWQPIGPSALAFSEGSPVPREMDIADIDAVVAQFTAAAGRSLDAGFQVIEVHAAHGYLLHQFLSPLFEPPHGRVRRLAGEPHEARGPGHQGGPRGLARKDSPVRKALGHRLGGRGMGPAAVDRTLPRPP